MFDGTFEKPGLQAVQVKRCGTVKARSDGDEDNWDDGDDTEHDDDESPTLLRLRPEA